MKVDENMKVLAAGRQQGKTTAAIEWLREGVRVPGYPGWSRVLIVPSQSMMVALRNTYWATVEDFDHRVYDVRTWREARGVDSQVEVMIEEAQMMLPPLPGRVIGMTITGQSWHTSLSRKLESMT